MLTDLTAHEAEVLACATVTAVSPDDGLTHIQKVLVEALFEAMTGHPLDCDGLAQVDANTLSVALEERDEAFKTRCIQLMLLPALVLRPLPPTVAERIQACARTLNVDEGVVKVAQYFAEGSLELAAIEFERSGYTANWTPEEQVQLHAQACGLNDPWDTCNFDPSLAAKWEALEDAPHGSIGRMVWEMYRARGFSFPGSPGSAPPLLAQHDWVHVLADYGTTVENELEVFAFIARANSDLRGFSLLAMVVSLFETGYLSEGAGLFEADPHHLSDDHNVAVRIADAVRRGALCHDMTEGVDFLGFDWFRIADHPIEAVRDRFKVPTRSEAAIVAGSRTCWEYGGISPFQLAAGKEAAAHEGRAYRSYGAWPTTEEVFA